MVGDPPLPSPPLQCKNENKLAALEAGLLGEFCAGREKEREREREGDSSSITSPVLSIFTSPLS